MARYGQRPENALKRANGESRGFRLTYTSVTWPMPSGPAAPRATRERRPRTSRERSRGEHRGPPFSALRGGDIGAPPRRTVPEKSACRQGCPSLDVTPRLSHDHMHSRSDGPRYSDSRGQPRLRDLLGNTMRRSGLHINLFLRFFPGKSSVRDR